jgi:methyl-accepting chemotaxis protein
MLLNNFSIKGRMYFVIGSILVLFLVMLGFTFYTAGSVEKIGLEKTDSVMLEGQKEKIQVACHTAALAAGNAVEGVEDKGRQIETIRKLINNIRFEKDESGYFFVYRKTTNVIHPIKEALEGKDLGSLKDTNGVYSLRELYEQSEKGGGFVPFVWNKPGTGDVAKLGYAEIIPGTDMWIGTGVYLDNIEAYTTAMSSEIGTAVTRITSFASIAASIIFVAIIVICLLISTNLVRGLVTMSTSFKEIADGDLTKRIAITSKDELADFVRSFNIFLEKIQAIICSLTSQTQTLGSEAANLTGIASSLAIGSHDGSERCHKVATAAEEMTSNLSTIAAAMEESTINTNMVASAAEEMTATINEIAANATEANEVSQQAVLQASGTSEKMAELDKAALAISKVTETINEISDQTNLLALNATIEAARAGEAGKGFAVVANEIKGLAKQTAEATRNIKQQIEGVQNTTTETVEGINQVSTVIENINELIITISSSIGEQKSVTEEVSSNITQAASGLSEVNENVSQVSVAAENINHDISVINTTTDGISDNSLQIGTSGSNLKRLTEELQKDINKFKV